MFKAKESERAIEQAALEEQGLCQNAQWICWLVETDRHSNNRGSRLTPAPTEGIGTANQTM